MSPREATYRVSATWKWIALLVASAVACSGSDGESAPGGGGAGLDAGPDVTAGSGGAGGTSGSAGSGGADGGFDATADAAGAAGVGGASGTAGAGGFDAGSDAAGAAGTGGTDIHLQPQSKSSQLLFDPASDSFNISYHSFRIPSVVRTVTGTLIAFAEGRQCSHADFGNINLVYKRSFDHGETWGPLQEVVGAGAGTWGNPTAVVDAQTGTIWLFLSWNAEDKSQYADTNPCTGEPTTAVGVGDRPVKLTFSTDDGATWSSPADMTQTLQPPGKKWDAMGPGVGIQTTAGPNPGRLIVPAIGRNIYSDDNGATWSYETIPGGTSEGTIVELSTGELLRNDRAVGSVWESAKRRWLSRGTIAGGFEDFWSHDTLLDPRVEGSAIRYSGAPHRIVFLNPASTVVRCKMRVRLSYDDGASWPLSRQLHDGMSADETCQQNLGGYSSMAVTADEHVGALVERVEAGAGNHRGIEFHRFNLSWILDGTPEPL